MSKPLRVAKQLAKKLTWPVRRYYCVGDYVFPQEAARRGTDVQNVRVLAPAQRVEIASPADDPFVRVGKFFKDGWFDRPDIFVCDVPEAYLHVGSGLVCTRHWQIVADLLDRLPYFAPFGKRRPRDVKRLAGSFATATGCWSSNHYHWMVDCLPRVVSLAKAEPETKLTLIMAESTGQVQRETLAATVPSNFTISYYPDNTWLQLERFVWASLVSDTCNSLLPPEYYEAIRRPIFERYRLPPVHTQKERLYLTRRQASCRRILNEDELVAFLQPYGFRTVELDKCSFREQVELFHSADIVLGPHGAGFNLLYFSGRVRAVVLHPTPAPLNHFHTLARGLGQDYHFVLHDRPGLNDDFEADIPALSRVFDEELALSRCDPATARANDRG
jgi:glycosyl transferase family 61